MRGAENANPVDLSPVEKLAGDETRLNALSDAHIVCDEKSDGVELQGHEQRHDLVRPGLARETAEGTERACAGTKSEPNGVAQQLAGDVTPQVLCARRLKGGGFNPFQCRVDTRSFLHRSTKRPYDKEISL
jgi:hypothetical protein